MRRGHRCDTSECTYEVIFTPQTRISYHPTGATVSSHYMKSSNKNNKAPSIAQIHHPRGYKNTKQQWNWNWKPNEYSVKKAEESFAEVKPTNRKRTRCKKYDRIQSLAFLNFSSVFVLQSTYVSFADLRSRRARSLCRLSYINAFAAKVQRPPEVVETRQGWQREEASADNSCKVPRGRPSVPGIAARMDLKPVDSYLIHPSLRQSLPTIVRALFIFFLSFYFSWSPTLARFFTKRDRASRITSLTVLPRIHFMRVCSRISVCCGGASLR